MSEPLTITVSNANRITYPELKGIVLAANSLGLAGQRATRVAVVPTTAADTAIIVYHEEIERHENPSEKSDQGEGQKRGGCGGG